MNATKAFQEKLGWSNGRRKAAAGKRAFARAKLVASLLAARSSATSRKRTAMAPKSIRFHNFTLYSHAYISLLVDYERLKSLFQAYEWNDSHAGDRVFVIAESTFSNISIVIYDTTTGT